MVTCAVAAPLDGWRIVFLSPPPYVEPYFVSDMPHLWMEEWDEEWHWANQRYPPEVISQPTRIMLPYTHITCTLCSHHVRPENAHDEAVPQTRTRK